MIAGDAAATKLAIAIGAYCPPATVSVDCAALLASMLDVNPCCRPSVAACLRHPFIGDADWNPRSNATADDARIAAAAAAAAGTTRAPAVRFVDDFGDTTGLAAQVRLRQSELIGTDW